MGHVSIVMHSDTSLTPRQLKTYLSLKQCLKSANTDFYSQDTAHLLRSSFPFPFSYIIGGIAAPKSNFLCCSLSVSLSPFSSLSGPFLDLFFSFGIRLSAL